jgi:hypothetical protein
VSYRSHRFPGPGCRFRGVPHSAQPQARKNGGPDHVKTGDPVCG